MSNRSECLGEVEFGNQVMIRYLKDKVEDLQRQLDERSNIPVATKSKIGGVIPGTNIDIDKQGTITIKEGVYATPGELLNKVDVEEGKGLSTNDFTNELKGKLNKLVSFDDTSLKNSIEDLKTNKVDKVLGKQLSTNDFTEVYKSKLDSLKNYDDDELRNKITLLENNKVEKEVGKQLSTNDFTTLEKEKLSTLNNYNDSDVKRDIESLRVSKADKLFVGTFSMIPSQQIDENIFKNQSGVQSFKALDNGYINIYLRATSDKASFTINSNAFTEGQSLTRDEYCGKIIPVKVGDVVTFQITSGTISGLVSKFIHSYKG